MNVYRKQKSILRFCSISCRNVIYQQLVAEPVFALSMPSFKSSMNEHVSNVKSQVLLLQHPNPSIRMEGISVGNMS